MLGGNKTDNDAIPVASLVKQRLLRDGIESNVTVGKRVVSLADRRWLAIVSSHLGKSTRRHRSVCRYLSRAMMDAKRDGHVVVIAQGSAIEPWARRAAELFAVPTILLSVQSIDSRTKQHGRKQHRVTSPESNQILVCGDRSLDRDALAVTIADRIDCVFVRRGGNIDRALVQCLTHHKNSRVRFAIHPDEPSKKSRAFYESLMDRGAIGWYCHCDLNATNHAPFSKSQSMLQHQPSIDWTRSEGQWLVHCTRACDGPWPAQSEQQYRDQMILGQEGSSTNRCRTPLDTLRRILWTDRLIASAIASSRATPVVCFSEAPLATLLAGRTYRSHLHRWDYEPYGIAIRKSAAIAAGFKQVIYGGPDERKRLAIEDRYRFQSRGRTFDWTDEREWRSREDVLLSHFDPADVRLFVGETDEISSIRSDYQVFAVGSLARSCGGNSNVSDKQVTEVRANYEQSTAPDHSVAGVS